MVSAACRPRQKEADDTKRVAQEIANEVRKHEKDAHTAADKLPDLVRPLAIGRQCIPCDVLFTA